MRRCYNRGDRPMRSTAVTLVIATALIIAGSAGAARVAAQNHPEFAGRWRLVAVDPPMDASQVLVVSFGVSATHMSTVTIERYYDDRSEHQEFAFGASGGVSGVGAGALAEPPAATRVDVSWKDDVLEIERTERAQGVAGESRTTERWRLDEGGRLTIEQTVQRGDQAAPTRGVAVYMREP